MYLVLILQLINEPTGIEAPLAARIDTTVQPTTRPTDQDGLSEAKLVPVIARYLRLVICIIVTCQTNLYIHLDRMGQPHYRLLLRDGLTEVSVLPKFELNKFPNES